MTQPAGRQDQPRFRCRLFAVVGSGYPDKHTITTVGGLLDVVAEQRKKTPDVVAQFGLINIVMLLAERERIGASNCAR
jgi:UDP-N-acetyl-D-mannosaminuronic acid transferase (WecB/TagA/CpsF family)